MTTIRRVRLVYPTGEAISAPQTIGRHLKQFLSHRYDVTVHDWQGVERLSPALDTALIGHPHPVALTTFRRSLGPGWGRTLTMMPVHTGQIGQLAFADKAVRASDHLLAITGAHWFAALAGSRLRHWADKAWHLDLAVDRTELPRIKGAFADPGRRRVLYVGSTASAKSPDYLMAIRRRLPEVEFGWIGGGGGLEGFAAYGPVDFRSEAAKDLIRRHDVSLTAGFADANPTTVLETAAWGLHPVCPPTSGYAAEPGLTSIPFGDPDEAATILREVLARPSDALADDRASFDRRLDEHFCWRRFAETVTAAIETPRRDGIGGGGPWSVRLAADALVGTSGPFQRPGYAMRRHYLTGNLRKTALFRGRP